MATTRSTARANRHMSVAAAPVVLVFSAIADFADLGGYLSGASIPAGIVAIWVLLGVAALVAAAGMRAGRRWAAQLTIAVATITVLLGAAGLLTADSTTGKVVSAADALLGLVLIALVASRVGRRAAA